MLKSLCYPKGGYDLRYLAHISGDRTREQPLIDHLKGTAELASCFAAPFGMENRAFRCGMAHDIGKYSEKFQKRIRGATVKTDHSTAGAIVLGGKDYGDIPSAFCIAGHHGGLPNGGNRFDTPESGTLAGRLHRKEGADIEPFAAYGTEVSLEPSRCNDILNGVKDPLTAFFAIRMLYSCLVDADFLDTERFMNNGQVSHGGYCSLAEMDAALNEHMERLSSSDSLLNRKRTEIRRTLLSLAESEKGLFSLTVPTGGGKTLASVSFALRHAIAHGLTRIIYVIPYCSIIEQTQKVFSEIFGEDNVVAHYANVEYSAEENGEITDKRYLSTENWDAPLILTTAVQFFESLYACRSSSCRKLHNLADSIIIFDEAQMLPVPYLRPCISAVSMLIRDCGCSAVLCTATQPSLQKLFDEFLPGVGIRELYSGGSDDTVFQRTRYAYEGLLTDDALSDRLSGEKQVLCIVNNRSQAQQLYERLPSEGSFYLTTTLYPRHRRKILEEIRSRLKNGLPCRVLSTSLIEAGVDVDFPTVYRALAGLDSICQSGGRCNREGKRPPWDSVIHIFESEKQAPSILRQNIGAARKIIDEYGTEMTCPEAIKKYFDFLFYVLKDERGLDSKDILGQIRNDFFPFASVAGDFHLIESPTRTVYILGRDDESRMLKHELAQEHFNRLLWRKLGQYAVSVYRQQYDALLEACALDVISDNAAVLTDNTLYDENTGLSLQPVSGGLIEF